MMTNRKRKQAATMRTEEKGEEKFAWIVAEDKASENYSVGNFCYKEYYH